MNILSVVIFGTGTMGQGIAEWFTSQNVIVEMVDHNHEFALTALNRIHQSFDKLQTKGKYSIDQVQAFKKNISVKHSSEINLNADLIIEAIIENADIKKSFFKDLDSKMSQHTVFASNTSSFPITELASSVSEDRKKKFLGLHFFNPATIMKLVEVINGLETNRDLSNKFVDWINQRNKVACLCSDSPGFIVNRVARNFYGEALRATETYDLEKIKEVDHVMKEVGGFKMGPFELMDLIGIDINYSVTDSVYRAFFDEPRFKPHRLQKEMVSANRLGKKTHKGFYTYDN